MGTQVHAVEATNDTCMQLNACPRLYYIYAGDLSSCFSNYVAAWRYLLIVLKAICFCPVCTLHTGPSTSSAFADQLVQAAHCNICIVQTKKRCLTPLAVETWLHEVMVRTQLRMDVPHPCRYGSNLLLPLPFTFSLSFDIKANTKSAAALFNHPMYTHTHNLLAPATAHFCCLPLVTYAMIPTRRYGAASCARLAGHRAAGSVDQSTSYRQESMP